MLELDENQKPLSITEKPTKFVSNLAVTGLYFFDHQASNAAKVIKPSPRGELEITSLIEHYLSKNELTFTALTRGTAWLDTGNPNSLNDAAAYIRIIEERTGLKIACLEEIAILSGWISLMELKAKLDSYGKNDYAKYLARVTN